LKCAKGRLLTKRDIPGGGRGRLSEVRNPPTLPSIDRLEGSIKNRSPSSKEWLDE